MIGKEKTLFEISVERADPEKRDIDEIRDAPLRRPKFPRDPLGRYVTHEEAEESLTYALASESHPFVEELKNWYDDVYSFVSNMVRR